MSGLLQLYRVRVKPDWIDYNNHLVDAYYLVIFCNATVALVERLGLGPKERELRKQALSTQETHLNYLREIKVGIETWVETQILGHDESRLRVFHTLYAEDSPDLRATNEQLLVNIATSTQEPVALLPEVLANIEALERDQVGLPQPPNAGRVISLPRRQTRAN